MLRGARSPAGRKGLPIPGNGKQLRFDDFRAAIARALCQPWLDGARQPDADLQQAIKDFLVAAIGNPQLRPGRWVGAESKSALIRRWLARASLKVFLALSRITRAPTRPMINNGSIVRRSGPGAWRKARSTTPGSRSALMCMPRPWPCRVWAATSRGCKAEAALNRSCCSESDHWSSRNGATTAPCALGPTSTVILKIARRISWLRERAASLAPQRHHDGVTGNGASGQFGFADICREGDAGGFE